MRSSVEVARRARQFVRRLHEDESAPSTVEWLLLLIVALVVLVGIYHVVAWVGEGTRKEAENMNEVRHGQP